MACALLAGLFRLGRSSQMRGTVFLPPDPRVRIVAALVYGVALWHTGWLGVTVCCVAVCFVLFQTSSSGKWAFIRKALLFSILWAGLKFIFSLFESGEVLISAEHALFFGIRLFTLLGVGLLLALTTSSLEFGRAVSFVLRPFAGRTRAWKCALSLSLMVHFIPMIMASVSDVVKTIRIRCVDVSLFRRMKLAPQILLRGFSQKSWTSAVAIAARRLDNPEAWECSSTLRARDYVWFLLILAGAKLVLAFG